MKGREDRGFHRFWDGMRFFFVFVGVLDGEEEGGWFGMERVGVCGYCLGGGGVWVNERGGGVGRGGRPFSGS